MKRLLSILLLMLALSLASCQSTQKLSEGDQEQEWGWLGGAAGVLLFVGECGEFLGTMSDIGNFPVSP